MPSKTNFSICIFLFILACLWSSLAIYPQKLISFDKNILVMSDFAYYATHIGAFWFDDKRAIYSLINHEQINSNLAGMNVSGATPLGITPIAAFIFLPFAAIARLNINASQILWVAISLTLLFLSFYKIVKQQINNDEKPIGALLISIFFVIAMTSTTMLNSILLGQTSIIATALITNLFANNTERKTKFITPLSFVVLCIKPTYAIFSAIILLTQKRYKELCWGILAITILLLGFTLLTSSSWLLQYMESISVLSSSGAVAGYKSAFEPGTANILRNVLIQYLPDTQALLISKYLFSFSMMIFLILFAKYLFKNNNLSNNIKNSFLISILLIELHLLLTPYVGLYEDLLFISLIAAVAPSSFNKFTSHKLISYSWIFIPVIFLFFNFSLFSNVAPLFLWINKLILSLILLTTLTYKTQNI